MRRFISLLVTLVVLSVSVGNRVALCDVKDAESEILKSLPWRSIGPSVMGGRIDDFAVVESKPGTIYVGTASGGVFRTTNFGVTWESLFDFEETTTIGAIAVAKSDTDIVWIGTGEANNRQSSSWGNGIYKSTDAGKTWKNMGLPESSAIGAVLIHPKDPNIVYVAAVGHLWKANPERGLYKTTDGGATWQNVLKIDADTGVTDAVMDPTNPEVIIAAAYQRRRAAWGFNGGGPGSGLFKTTDGGRTWKKLTQGLSTKEKGRIGLAFSRKDPKIVFAIIEDTAGSIFSTTGTGGVYRSADSGDTWTMQSNLDPRPMYYSKITPDPNNADKLWVLGVSLHYSEDAGKTWRVRGMQKIHSDFHTAWVDPLNSNHLFVGNDGGMWQSYDNGLNWEHINNIPLGQFYEIAYDMKKPYWVFGGLQDNYSWGGPSANASSPNEGPVNDDWINIGGGDGFYNMVDWSNDDIVYQESQNGGIIRLNVATGERKSIQPRALPGEKAYQFDWNAPMLVSPHNPKKIYMGGNRLFISHSRGDSWDRTDDLTGKPDRSKMPIMGVNVDPAKTLSANDGQDSFGQIVTLTESPVKQGVVYVGTDDGLLQVSKDDGKTWKSVADKVPGLPKGTYVCRVVASKFAEGRCYAAFDGHRSGDFEPYIFVTEDFGETWSRINSGIPVYHTLHVIREHHRNPNLLFAGTERGLYVSFNRGAKWQKMGAPLPSVPVDDIQIHRRENDLILGTHGRSIWILDDITHLEQLSDALTKPSTLFTPRDKVMFRISGKKGFTGSKPFFAPNPPSGAILQYFVRDEVPEKEEFRLEVLDNKGTVVARIGAATRSSGHHRVFWDMRYGSGLRRDEKPIAGLRTVGFQTVAPFVIPGKYTVRLTSGSTVQSYPINIEEDPRLHISPSARKLHFDTVLKYNRTLEEANTGRTLASALLDDLGKVTGDEKYKAAPKEVTDAVAAYRLRLEKLRDQLSSFGGGGPRGGGAGGGARGGGGGPGGGAAGGGRGGAGGRGGVPRGGGAAVPGAAVTTTPGEAPSGEGPPQARPPQVASVAARLSRAASGLNSITEEPSEFFRNEVGVLQKEMKSLTAEAKSLSSREFDALNSQLRKANLPEMKRSKTE